MGNSKILIVDDEPGIVGTIRAYLEPEGFTVYASSDGRAGLQAARSVSPDLVVLDIMLPGMDGLEVLRELRQESNVYVLMLTAKAEEVDKIVGLRVGADDYVTKPFSPRELVARIQAILRRGRGAPPDIPQLHFRRVRIDPGARLAWKDETLLDLTPTEFDLLHALARHRGHVLSRDQLMSRCGGMIITATKGSRTCTSAACEKRLKMTRGVRL